MLRYFLILFILSLPAQAQKVVFKQDSSAMWIGGLNSPQVQKMDLDLDGRQDLVIFDRTASRYFTFLALPTNTWQYAPMYERIFPKTQGWFLLRDYNQDGMKDLFTHTSAGIQGWTAQKKSQSIEFKHFKEEYISTKGLSGKVNLQVAITDIPAMHDIDGNGTLDVLTFDFGQGSLLELHLNTSTDKNILQLERQGYCWGNLWEGSKCGELKFDFPCGGGESLLTVPPSRVRGLLHTGSTLNVIDLNQDDRLDLLVGDISCKRLYAIYNKGTSIKPIFSHMDTLFPASKPVNMSIFPATFIEDVTFDDIPDLLVAPNVFHNEKGEVDFQHSLWLYAGKGKKRKKKGGNFQFQTDAFLQEKMLDLGESAKPLFWDYDQDGDYDLIVGIGGAGLHLFENTGTKKKPNFELKTKDFWGLSAEKITAVMPFTADTDQDGRQELHILAYQNRERIWRYKQEAGKEWKRFDYTLGRQGFPLLFDFDEDKDLDLLISQPNHVWEYFENRVGEGFKKSTLPLNLPANGYAFIEKYPLITDLNGDAKPDMLCEMEGKMWLYSDVHAQRRAGKVWEGVPIGGDFGLFAYPTFADLDDDGRAEIAMGLSTGGIALFWNKAE